MKHLMKIAKQISILILTISLFGCTDENTNYPEVVAGYTYTINPATGTVVFINTSENAKTYEWDFADGETSTEINPIKTFAPGTYTVVLKSKNLAGASDTYESVITITVPTIPCNAEAAESLLAASLNMTFKTEPVAGSVVSDGASFAWVSNPSYDNAINSSCKVGKVSKQGINPWDNVQIVLGSKLDLSANGGFKIKVYSSVPGYKLLLKLEDKANASINTEVEVATTKTSAWEELTFDFPATATGKFDKIVVIFDLATKNSNTYYFDDLKLFTRVGGVVVPPTPSGPCNAEAIETLTATGLNMTFKTDLSASIISDGAGFSWADNPNATGSLNPSCKVGKVTKSGQFPWDNNQINLNAKLDFTANAGLKIKVYSAKAGYKVRLKLEEIGNANNNTELELSTTKTNDWEELTFPFAATNTNKFNKIVIFFDLNASNKDTYYFDDLKLYERTTSGGGGGTVIPPAAGEIATNGGFENGNLDGWAVYKNGGIVEAVNTDSKTGTWSAMLVASPSGLNPTLKQERKGAGGIKVGDRVKISFDYKGSLAGISGAYSIQSFVEATNGVNQIVNISVTPTNTWQSFTTTYTVLAGDVSGGITSEFVAICGGVPGCNSTLYLDNISIIINP